MTICKCGYRRNLRKESAKTAEAKGVCRRCSNAEKAPKGFAAMAALYGHYWAIQHVHRTLEERISKPEQMMMRLLESLGISYQRNILLSTKTRGRKRWSCILDFYIRVGNVWAALEVDGEYFHAINPRHVRNDRRKNNLLKRRGIPLIRITDRQLKNGAAETLLQGFIEQHSYSLSA